MMQDIYLSDKQYRALVKRLDEINQDVSSIKVNACVEFNYINNVELLTLLQVSARTALRWRKSGRLPYVQIGRKLYYRTDVIMNSFRMRPDSVLEVVNSPPDDTVAEEVKSETGCEKCPLFVILNS